MANPEPYPWPGGLDASSKSEETFSWVIEIVGADRAEVEIPAGLETVILAVTDGPGVPASNTSGLFGVEWIVRRGGRQGFWRRRGATVVELAWNVASPKYVTIIAR